MSSNIDVDIPKRKARHTTAMVYRSHQGLRKELKNIDTECLKALSGIDRDLEKTRDSLKALRVGQKQSRVRSDLIGGHNAHKQRMDFRLGSVVPMPTPPLRRRSRACTLPLKSDGSLKMVAERRRTSEVTVRPQVGARKIVGMRLGREGEIYMKQDELNGRESQRKMKESIVTENLEEEEFEVSMNQLQGRESQLSNKTVSTIACSSRACDSSEVDGELGTRMAETQGGLRTKVAEVQGELDSKVAEVQEDVDISGAEFQGGLGTSVSEVRGELGTSVIEDQSKEPGNENGPSSRPSSPGNKDENDHEVVAVQEASVKQVLRNSWTNDDGSKKETVDKNPLFFPNKTNIIQEESGTSCPTLSRKRLLTRRASSPNLMFTTTPTDPVPNKPKIGCRPSLTSIQEKFQGNTSIEIFPPSERPPPRPRMARRSSIAVMTGVSSPLVPGSPNPRSLVRSLPDLNGTSQINNALDFEKYSFKRRGSVQENQMHESLRKISRRLTTPLTGAQLEKRLQAHAHRVGAMSAAIQTRVACTPDSKAPNELDMSDLEDCRYLRRRVSK